MVGQVDLEPHVLFVTGPLRQRLYDHFTLLFQGREGVEVRIDRRVAERRHDPRGRRVGDRRQADRRHREPDWVVPPLQGT